MKPVRANMGVRDEYSRSMRDEIKEMRQDVQTEIMQFYKNNPPAVSNDDQGNGGSSKELLALLAALAIKWQFRFNDFGVATADKVVNDVVSHANRVIAKKLKSNDVIFDLTDNAAIQDAINLSVAENTKLIKSIPQKYFDGVQSVMTEAVNNGKGEDWLSKQLTEQFGITNRRAKGISRDQVTKISAAIVLARQIQLGVTEAIWRHTNRAKTQRPKHVAASGSRYKVDKGLMIEGEHIYPGQKINCMCVSEWIIN